jgi:DNA-binding NtrC family response regulator
MSMSRRVLLIEGRRSLFPFDDTGQTDDRSHFRPERADWASLRPETLVQHPADLVIAVAAAGPEDPIRFFRWLREHPIAAPVLAVLPESPERELLRTVAEAADDFIFLPVREEEWRLRVCRILGEASDDVVAARLRLRETIGLTNLVGRDPAFLRTIESIPLLARAGRPVLLTGETGTGKELCARAIHHLSARGSFAFIPIDCGAVPDHLFENELFGHARGAFTDARTDQKGLIAIANGGTLFLDEVDSLSPLAQAKLLRFLQDRTYKPLGAERFCHADVNVLAATNRDLEQLVRDRLFRADLFFRLNILRLHLAPLRERRADVPILARHFAEVTARESGQPRKVITPSALRLLERHDWPGNIRQLHNVVQQAVFLAEGTQILPSHIGLPNARPEGPGPVCPTLGFRQARAFALATFERTYVEELLHKHSGNITRAAREAQKDRRAFGRLVKKHQVSRADS